MVVIAIPSESKGGLSDKMDARFGRCQSFTFVTINKEQIKEVKTIPNPAKDEMGGAGILASQTVYNEGANEVIVGFLGPNAINSLKSLNLKVFQAPNNNLPIREVVDMHINGKLSIVDTPNVGRHHGGRGAGRGYGREGF
jgi:predicted Fe-Mo cluster-binding NifX family protein